MRASSANASYQGRAADDFEAYFVITEDEAAGAPTAQYCQQKRTQFGLTMPVLIDDQSELRDALFVADNHVDIVLDEGVRMTFKDQYGSASTVDAAIDAALGP